MWARNECISPDPVLSCPALPLQLLEDGGKDPEERQSLRARLELPVQAAVAGHGGSSGTGSGSGQGSDYAKEVADCKQLIRTLIICKPELCRQARAQALAACSVLHSHSPAWLPDTHDGTACCCLPQTQRLLLLCLLLEGLGHPS